MSVWHNPAAAAHTLLGIEGELVVVSITIDPHRLEELLDALAHVPFPVNPQIYHQTGVVEFPAYERRVEEVRAALEAFHFDASVLRVRGMLDDLQSQPGGVLDHSGARSGLVIPYKQDGPIC